jgi:hypothetical protein
MNLPALASRCCAPIRHIARHRAAQIVAAAGTGAAALPGARYAAGNTAVSPTSQSAGPAPAAFHSGCSGTGPGAAVPVGSPAIQYVPADFVDGSSLAVQPIGVGGGGAFLSARFLSSPGSVGAGATDVPEPGAVVIFALAAVFVIAMRRVAR